MQLTLRERISLNLAIRIKRHTFKKIGHTEISSEDIKEYLVQYRWKRNLPSSLHQKFTDVQNFSINDFFDYQQVKVLTSEKDSNDLNDFLDLF